MNYLIPKTTLNFSWQRLFLFTKIETYTNSREYLMFPIIMQILYFCLCTLAVLAGSSNFNQGSFLLSLSILISIISISKAFASEQNPTKVSFSLLLPASITEKFIAKLFLTGPMLIFINIIPFIIISLFFRLVTWLWFSTHDFPPLPGEGFYSKDALHNYSSFFFFHSIFFAGAIFFRTHRIVKTTLCFIAFIFVLLICIITLGIPNIFQISLINISSLNFRNTQMGDLANTLILLVPAIIALTLYVLSFFRFKNLQVS